MLLKKKSMMLAAALSFGTFFSSTPISANAESVKADPAKLELLQEDLVYIKGQIDQYKKDHPNADRNELEAFTVERLYEASIVNKEGAIYPSATYFGYKLNTEELKVCGFNPIDCSDAYSAKNSAEGRTAEYYSDGFLNGNADAFRHSFWNALMTKRIGASEAKKFADAHENGADGQPALQKSMDLTNNAKGRSYGEAYKSVTERTLSTRIRDRVSEGNMVRISGSKLIPTNSSGRK